MKTAESPSPHAVPGAWQLLPGGEEDGRGGPAQEMRPCLAHASLGDNSQPRPGVCKPSCRRSNGTAERYSALKRSVVGFVETESRAGRGGQGVSTNRDRISGLQGGMFWRAGAGRLHNNTDALTVPELDAENGFCGSVYAACVLS